MNIQRRLINHTTLSSIIRLGLVVFLFYSYLYVIVYYILTEPCTVYLFFFKSSQRWLIYINIILHVCAECGEKENIL